MSITLTTDRGEARIDSRLVAEQLGNQHKNVIGLVRTYQQDFAELGRVAFETRTMQTAGGPQKYEVALLNENQCYLLLTYSRNTPRARALKINLVRAFSEARNRTSALDAQHLPLYHAMHAEVSALARRAKECGSSTPEHLFHITANKALNAAMGIANGEQHTLTIEQQLILATLQAVYRRHLHSSLANGDDHREAGRKAREALQTYMATAGGLLLGERAA